MLPEYVYYLSLALTSYLRHVCNNKLHVHGYLTIYPEYVMKIYGGHVWDRS